MQNKFRKFNNISDSLLKETIYKNTNPLILIDGVTGLSTYTNVLVDKLEFIKNYKQGQLLLLSWGGKYKTDVFELDKDILDRVSKI